MISPAELRDLELTRHEILHKRNDIVNLLNQAVQICNDQLQDTSDIQNISASIFVRTDAALQRIDELIEVLSNEPEPTEEK